jgi:hypothetical protein
LWFDGLQLKAPVEMQLIFGGLKMPFLLRILCGIEQDWKAVMNCEQDGLLKGLNLVCSEVRMPAFVTRSLVTTREVQSTVQPGPRTNNATLEKNFYR